MHPNDDPGNVTSRSIHVQGEFPSLQRGEDEVLDFDPWRFRGAEPDGSGPDGERLEIISDPLGEMYGATVG